MRNKNICTVHYALGLVVVWAGGTDANSCSEARSNNN